MSPSGCANCANGVIALNNAIPAWASSKSTSQSPIYVVDQWSGFSSTSDNYDGVHPNNNGNTKIANKWFSTLVNLV